MRWLLAFAVPCCVVACRAAGDDAKTARELSALRDEVYALRDEVDALSAQRTQPAQPATDAGVGTQAKTPTVAAPQQVTLRFVVEPVDATVRVDGVALEGHTLRRPASHRRVDVRVDHAGFRSIEQQVSLGESRELRYQLMPGRGVTRLGRR